MKKIFAAAALLLAMTACGGSQKKALPLEGTTWKLAKMEAIPAKAIDAEADFFTLQFSAADTLVSGRTNCNRFFGKYELKGQKLEFENLGMTRMACPEMQYEDAFVKMLDEVDGYEIKGGVEILRRQEAACRVPRRAGRCGSKEISRIPA